MFGRKKKQEEVDWTAGLGQPVPPSTPGSPTPVQAGVVKLTTQLTGTPQVQVFGAASPEQIKRAYEMAERVMNTDLDGDGKVAGGAAAPGGSPMAGMLGALGAAATPATPAPAEDVVSQLERLAKLHETGALTDEEFAAEKKKLIG
jgi:hypothetical protein